MSKNHIDKLLQMTHGSLTNYIVPGLESHLVGLGSVNVGRVRIFKNTRTQNTMITPHSHRFDFVAQVLRGWVCNTVYEMAENGASMEPAEEWVMSELEYGDEPGDYSIRTPGAVRPFTALEDVYNAGDWYGMSHDQIHSITFSPDAVVLFIEGATLGTTSVILEPWVNNKKVPTFRVESWMFQREGQA